MFSDYLFFIVRSQKANLWAHLPESPWVTEFLHTQAWGTYPILIISLCAGYHQLLQQNNSQSTRKGNGGTWEDGCLAQVYPHSAWFTLSSAHQLQLPPQKETPPSIIKQKARFFKVAHVRVRKNLEGLDLILLRELQVSRRPKGN